MKNALFRLGAEEKDDPPLETPPALRYKKEKPEEQI